MAISVEEAPEAATQEPTSIEPGMDVMVAVRDGDGDGIIYEGTLSEYGMHGLTMRATKIDDEDDVPPALVFVPYVHVVSMVHHLEKPKE